MAILLLAHAAMPGRVEAATVDHGLRAESGAEAAMVARTCRDLGVKQQVLRVEVGPGNLQNEARQARYDALSRWMNEGGLAALLTAHHADDQAETLLMRLNRGSGLAGLAGVRPAGKIPGQDQLVLRPLLSWRKSELEELLRYCGLAAAEDPSNTDERFDRARMRRALQQTDWIDPLALSRSAANLADAEEALAWSADREWRDCVAKTDDGFLYRPGAPVKNATLIGHGPTVLQQVSMIGNDFAMDDGVGVCGKAGQSVPVGVGQPTLKVGALTVGGAG